MGRAAERAMSRGLDHIVHAVRDLDAAAALYERLGFVVGTRNRHDWGTHNRIVQFDGFFIELLTLGDPERLGSDGLSTLFGRFHQTFLERGEGLSMLLLAGTDAAADARAFSEAKIAASGPLRFERQGRRPDGTPVKLAFSLAFARDPAAPAAGFAVCQHHFPENFWNPDFQVHPNTACGVAGAVLVADNPADHHIFLSAFAGERELQSTSSGVAVKTVRGDIRIMDAAAFHSHFGAPPPDPAGGMTLAALRLFVRDMDAADAVLQRAGVALRRRAGRRVVGPQAAFGATLVFEPAAD
jgi:hypothetical protein